MFGIGTGELLLLLLLALLVLGPERMPRLARDIGKTVGDLRKTSDELRQEFLNADALIDRAARIDAPAVTPPAELAAPASPGDTAGPEPAAAASPEAPAAPAEAAAAPAEAPATQADVAVPEPEPDETAFDREARLARERLEDPARAERAAAEGWPVPTDQAGTNTDRWG